MKRSLICLLIGCLCNGILQADDFSMKEKSIIYTNAINIIENYQNILNTIGETAVTDMEKAKSSSEGFLELFVNRLVLLFNDLDPAHKLSEFYEAETYASNLILWYPDGISITMDLANARVSDIMNHDENVYSIDILVSKSVNGNYLNQTLNRNTQELTFRIAFGIENKDFTNFRIVGIRNASSNMVVDYSKALREVNSEDLNSDDLNKIYSDLKTVLQDYSNFLALLGDPQEAEEDKTFYKESFRKLFNAATRVYNDIRPEPETKLISVEDYLAGFTSDYPDGIKNIQINIDSARFGKVMKQDDGTYYTFVDANKFFSGSYRGKDAFRQMFPLIFRISFNKSGKTFSDFIINSIDISSENFYEDTPEGTLEKKPSMTISPVTRKGLSLSLSGAAGFTSITSKNVESLTISENAVEWDMAPYYGFVGALGITYFYNENLAFRTGLEFNSYSGKYSLTGKYTDNVLTAEAYNQTLFYKTVEAQYDSVVSVNYLTVPLLFHYTSGKPGIISFYGEGGTKISIPLSGSYSNSGKYDYYGYYPAAPLGSNIDKIPEKGFYTRDPVNNSSGFSVKGLNFALYASAGISIPVGYYTSVSVGPEMTLGISDILRNRKSYTDIFGKNYDNLPTRINNFGLKISFAYKL